MRKIKVWGGTHGEEKKALAVVDPLIADPILNVDADIANPLARSLGIRFVDHNLTFSFPGNPGSPLYEERRAAEIVRDSQGYDAVIDLHNNNGNGEDTAYINPEYGVSPIILGFLGGLGIRNLIAHNSLGLPKVLSNTLILEAEVDGDLVKDPATLHAAFDKLANDPNPVCASAAEFKWFKHMGDLHIDMITPECLGKDTLQNLSGFDRMPQVVSQRLGLKDTPIHVFMWNAVPNAQGYWAEVCTPVAVPDDSAWPK